MVFFFELRRFWSIKTISVACMPDEINSKEMSGSLSQERKDKLYFTISGHSKRDISLYKGIDTGARSSLFLRNCSVSGTFSVSSNSKSTDRITCKYKKFRFNDSFERGSEKRAAMVSGGEPTTNERENLDKFTAPNNNINQCFLGRFGGLFSRSKDISGE